MSPAAKTRSLNISIAFVGLVMSVAFSSGYAQRELAAKEDHAAHDNDVRLTRDSLRQVVGARREEAIRDSAWKAETRALLVDVACAQNPELRRRYCRGDR